MESPSPAAPTGGLKQRKGLRVVKSGRLAALRAGSLAVLAVGMLAGCDSAVGIDGTDYHRSDPAPETAHSSATRQTAPATPTAELEPAATVALTTADPDTTAALTRWATDLQRLTPAELEAKCWTIAPQNVDTMYADHAAILAALAQPGADNGTAVVWQSPATAEAPITVVAQRADIETGYACPRVYPAGTETGFGAYGTTQTADARHVVRRYLARVTGSPVNPADEQSTHPLICTAGTAWDPTGIGAAAQAPAATNPNQLPAPTAFADQSISSTALNSTYLSIAANVTAGGIQQERTYTVKATDDGYCIGDISAG